MKGGMRRVYGARMLMALAMWGCSGLAQAQAPFPSRPITIIVPASPGGILDQTSRLVAAELTKLVNQPVLVLFILFSPNQNELLRLLKSTTFLSGPNLIMSVMVLCV